MMFVLVKFDLCVYFVLLNFSNQ